MIDLFKSSYYVETICENCKETTNLKIPKGIYVYEHLKRKECTCYHCGCRIRSLVNEELIPEELELTHKEELARLREKVEKIKNRPKFLRPKEEE